MSTSSGVAAPATGQQPMGTTMKQQGAQTAQGAKQTGQRVAHTAMEQGRQVVEETRQKARGMVDQTRIQLRQQAGEQQKRAAGSLHQLGEQLRSMANKTEQPGLAKDLVGQASGRVQQFADWLDRREPGQALDDVRDVARRHPGAFLTGAAILGALAGRFTRNLAGGHADGGMGMPEIGRHEVGHPGTRPMEHMGREEARR